MSENYQSLAKKSSSIWGDKKISRMPIIVKHDCAFKVKEEKRIDQGELEALDGGCQIHQ